MFTKNKVKSMMFAVTLFGVSQLSIAGCIQDQYGNQYNIVADNVHKSITGTATMTQCGGEVWEVIGSYVSIVSDKNIKIQEITAVRPQGSLTGCVDYFMLKGTYPNFAWYYDSGYGGQASKFAACGTPVVAPAAADEGSAIGAVTR